MAAPVSAFTTNSSGAADAVAMGGGLLDKLSPADLSRLVSEAAQGKLKSAKALRDALNLPVTVQRVQQMLSSDEFQRRVKQQQQQQVGGGAGATKRASAVSGERAEDGDDEDDAMGENDMDSDDDYSDDDDDEDDEDDDECMKADALRVKSPAEGGDATMQPSGNANDSGGNAATTEQRARLTTRPSKAADERNRKSRGPATAAITAPDGRLLTITMNEKFKDRASVKQAVRDFAAAQGKSVLIQKKTNGGNNFVYVCKSKTRCDFYVKVRRTMRTTTTTHVVWDFHIDHGPECTGKPLKKRYPPRGSQAQFGELDTLPVKSATVTMKDGSTLTLYEKQEFATRTELKDFVHDFALAQEKRARVDRLSSGGNNITFICTSQTKCNFKVRTLRSKKTHKHYVKSFEVDHGDECSGKPSVTKRQVLKHLQKIDANPTLALSGADVQAMVKSLQGVEVTSRVASDARYELVGKVLKDAMTGIQKLESLLSQFQALNPTSATQIEFDEDSTFKRAFLKLPFATQVQSHSARVLGLSTWDMGLSSNFRGMMLELVVKDSNGDAFTSAVALCDGKSAESYVWFLNCCVMGGISFDAPMFCDRNSAILNAVESLPIPFTLIQCTQNLILNIELSMPQPLPSDVRAEILRAQDADTESEYKAALAALGAMNPQVAEYLRSTDPNTWAKYCYLKRFPLYGCQSASLVSSISETASPTSNSTRELGPFEFFQTYMDRCMKSLYEGKRNARNWTNSGRTLTAFAENALKKQESEALACRVVPSDDESGIAYVWDTRSALPKKRRVNLSASSCTCSFLEQLALPCKHIVAAVNLFNGDGATWDISQLCHPMYTAKAYFEVYGQVSPIDIPVEEELVRNLLVKIAPSATSNRCSVCHEIGHNKRRCKSAIAMEMAGSSAGDSSTSSTVQDVQDAVVALI